MADSHSPSAASAASSSCNVYRLKHNPSWTKFGTHPRTLTGTNARSSRPTSRCPSAYGASAAHSPVSSANASFLSTASAREPTPMRSSALVGAQAALRHELYPQVHAAPRLTDRQSLPFHASDVRGASHPPVSGSAFETPRTRSDAEVTVCGPERASWKRAVPIREGVAMRATPVLTTLKNESGFWNYGNEMPCASDKTKRFAISASSYRAEANRDSPLRPSVLSLPTTSTSRAKDSHLRGSAALVAIAGPMDALYVPLRRPAPRGCVAIRQNFSLFQSTHHMRASDRSEKEAGVATGTSAGKRIGRHGIVGDAPETDTYRTTSSAYGLGC